MPPVFLTKRRSGEMNQHIGKSFNDVAPISRIINSEITREKFLEKFPVFPAAVGLHHLLHRNPEIENRVERIHLHALFTNPRRIPTFCFFQNRIRLSRLEEQPLRSQPAHHRRFQVRFFFIVMLQESERRIWGCFRGGFEDVSGGGRPERERFGAADADAPPPWRGGGGGGGGGGDCYIGSFEERWKPHICRELNDCLKIETVWKYIRGLSGFLGL